MRDAAGDVLGGTSADHQSKTASDLLDEAVAPSLATKADPRVGLILAGHMHGGQVVIPGIGYHCLPAQYGDKYVAGLVQGPVVPAYVSRGVGVIGLPIRFRCRPEINLVTLVQA